MLYQKLLMKADSYTLGYSKRGTKFQRHRHPEFEFNYCLSGDGYKTVIDGTEYEMSEGMLLAVGGMEGHEYEYTSSLPSSAVTVTLVVGSVFLGEYYEPFSKAIFKSPVFNLKEERYAELKSIFDELAECASSEKTSYSKLLERGKVYVACALILKHLIEPSSEVGDSSALISISNIEKAVEYINTHSTAPVTVAEVAASCGYSESNFCKHFKKITGTSFHASLNEKRIQNACAILKNTTLPLEAVAIETGFADAKSLCRVFKKTVGTTPTKYRRSKA